MSICDLPCSGWHGLLHGSCFLGQLGTIGLVQWCDCVASGTHRAARPDPVKGSGLTVLGSNGPDQDVLGLGQALPPVWTSIHVPGPMARTWDDLLSPPLDLFQAPQCRRESTASALIWLAHGLQRHTITVCRPVGTSLDGLLQALDHDHLDRRGRGGGAVG